MTQLHNCRGVRELCSGGVGVKKLPRYLITTAVVLQVGVEGDMLKVWMLTMLLCTYAIINTYFVRESVILLHDISLGVWH